MGQRRKDRELFWQGVIQRQVESGLSVSAFCRQESISAASLYGWREKLRDRNRETPRQDGSVAAEARYAPQLVPVRVEGPAMNPTPVRIFLAQGMSLELPGGIDWRALVELLAALREAQRC